MRSDTKRPRRCSPPRRTTQSYLGCLSWFSWMNVLKMTFSQGSSMYLPHSMSVELKHDAQGGPEFVLVVLEGDKVLGRLHRRLGHLFGILGSCGHGAGRYSKAGIARRAEPACRSIVRFDFAHVFNCRPYLVPVGDAGLANGRRWCDIDA